MSNRIQFLAKYLKLTLLTFVILLLLAFILLDIQYVKFKVQSNILNVSSNLELFIEEVGGEPYFIYPERYFTTDKKELLSFWYTFDGTESFMVSFAKGGVKNNVVTFKHKSHARPVLALQKYLPSEGVTLFEGCLFGNNVIVVEVINSEMSHVIFKEESYVLSLNKRLGLSGKVKENRSGQSNVECTT